MRNGDHDDPRIMKAEEPSNAFWFGLLLAVGISVAGWLFFAWWLATAVLC